MNPVLKKMILLVGLAVCGCQPLLTTDAVHGREEQVIAISEQFLQALFSKDLELTVALSKMPFLMDNQAILGSTHEWKTVLTHMYDNRLQAKVTVVSAKVMSPLEVQVWNMFAWSQLLRYRFDRQAYVLTDLNIQGQDGSIAQEKILLIVHYTEDGRWRICGFLRPITANVIE